MARDMESTGAALPERRSARPQGGFSLGRIMGVEFVADWSLLIIFTLIAINLGGGLIPAWHPDWGAGLVWLVALLAAVLFFVSIAMHELAHAVVARRYGIPVRRITLFVFGGMAHMEREPPSPRAELMMAAVGPAVSLLFGLAAMALGSALSSDAVSRHADDPVALARALGPVSTLLLWLGPINVLLGVFNLIPGFPLDGGRVLRAILWWRTGDLERATRWASGVGRAVAWILMAAGVSMLFGVRFPFVGGGPIQGLWFLLIGWFLNNAARASYQQLLIRSAFEDVTVADVMRRQAQVVPPDLTLDQLVRDYFMQFDQQAFPVVGDEDQLLGLVEIGQVRAVPPAQWSQVAVREIMTPAEQVDAIRPDQDAIQALHRLADHEQIPVVVQGRVTGVLRRQDLMRWLALRTELTPA
jgi:Zn-dependent protease/CBS domain-containing protein